MRAKEARGGLRGPRGGLTPAETRPLPPLAARALARCARARARRATLDADGAAHEETPRAIHAQVGGDGSSASSLQTCDKKTRAHRAQRTHRARTLHTHAVGRGEAGARAFFRADEDVLRA